MQEQEIRRPGQQEPTGRAIAIDGALDRVQQLGRPQDLVDRHRLRAADQRLGVVARGVADVQVIQRQVAPAVSQEITGQRAPASLARPGHDDRRHDGQAVAGGLEGQTRACRTIHAMNDIYSRRGLPKRISDRTRRLQPLPQ